MTANATTTNAPSSILADAEAVQNLQSQLGAIAELPEEVRAALLGGLGTDTLKALGAGTRAGSAIAKRREAADPECKVELLSFPYTNKQGTTRRKLKISTTVAGQNRPRDTFFNDRQSIRAFRAMLADDEQRARVLGVVDAYLNDEDAQFTRTLGADSAAWK